MLQMVKVVGTDDIKKTWLGVDVVCALIILTMRLQPIQNNGNFSLSHHVTTYSGWIAHENEKYPLDHDTYNRKCCGKLNSLRIVQVYFWVWHQEILFLFMMCISPFSFSYLGFSNSISLFTHNKTMRSRWVRNSYAKQITFPKTTPFL